MTDERRSTPVLLMTFSSDIPFSLFILAKCIGLSMVRSTRQNCSILWEEAV